MRKMPTNLSHKEATFLYWCALDKIENESRDHAVFIFGSEENGGHDSTEMITQKEIRSLVNNLAEEVKWRQDMKMIQKVVCADCGTVCPASMETFGSKLSMHDGIWADCPECGLTGYDEIVVDWDRWAKNNLTHEARERTAEQNKSTAKRFSDAFRPNRVDP